MCNRACWLRPPRAPTGGQIESSVACSTNHISDCRHAFYVYFCTFRKLMLANTTAIFILLVTFYSASSAHPYAFAGSLWTLYFCMAGVFSMHPALCGRIFGPGKDLVAIGLIGSSDIPNSLIIGTVDSTTNGIKHCCAFQGFSARGSWPLSVGRVTLL